MPRSTRKRRPADAPSPEHEHRRRLLSGQTVPATAERRSWLDHVPPGPRVNGSASLNSDHPSHLHRPMPLRSAPVDPSRPPSWSEELYLAVPKAPGLPRRRRRQLARDLRGVGQHIEVAVPASWQPRNLATAAKPGGGARSPQARALARDAKKQRRADNPLPKAIDVPAPSRAVLRWLERHPGSPLVRDVKAAHSLASGALHSAAAERQAKRLGRA